jgi:hypothetical protein
MEKSTNTWYTGVPNSRKTNTGMFHNHEKQSVSKKQWDYDN